MNESINKDSCGCVRFGEHKYIQLCPEHLNEVLETGIDGSQAVHALDAIMKVYSVGLLADFKCIPIPREILTPILAVLKCYLEDAKKDRP